MAQLELSINGAYETGIKIDFYDGIQKTFNILNWLGIEKGFIDFCNRSNLKFSIDDPCSINLDTLGKNLRKYIIVMHESSDGIRNNKILDAIIYLNFQMKNIKNGKNIIFALYDFYKEKSRSNFYSNQNKIKAEIEDLI